MIWLAAAVFAAFLAEAVAGFGGTILALGLGAQLMPLSLLLPVLVPVNLLLSAGIALQGRDVIDVRLLGRRILPAMIVGMPLGLLAYRLAGGGLRPVFAGLVVVLAVFELVKIATRRVAVVRRAPVAAGGLLFLGGVVHGAYGTGGPLVVLAAGGELGDKRAFRATLALLWLLLNCVLLIGFIADGHIGRWSLGRSAMLVPAALAAIRLGERVAARVPERPFRLMVALLLGAAGVLLMLRGA